MKTDKRVLIVDGSAEFCTCVTGFLELEGFKVMTVHNGFEAFEAVRHNRFDVVLMDIQMPVMDGVETLKRVKGVAPETSVIMITDCAVEHLMKEALWEGAFGILRKPIQFEKLLSCIQTVLRGGALIMVADDDQGLCANLFDGLTERGYRVMIAHDGRSAVQAARGNSFDIILLDPKLPTINGLEAYLTVQDIRPAVVRILITGDPGETTGSVQQALGKAASVCLQKPLDMDHLLKLLQECMESKTPRHCEVQG
jgi:DNA-binding response OmpR family regulator